MNAIQAEQIQMTNERQGDWLQTYTCRRFYPVDPRPGDIDIMDIAHSLSQLCRFTGHTKTHYSVAQHSVLVSQNVSPTAAMFALFHDAAEAYIGDLSRPLKRCLNREAPGAVKRIEDRIMACVVSALSINVTDEIIAETKKADDLLLVTEARDFMAPMVDGWRHSPENGFPILPDRITPWTTGKARWEFLEQVRRLTEVELRIREREKSRASLLVKIGRCYGIRKRNYSRQNLARWQASGNSKLIEARTGERLEEGIKAECEKENWPYSPPQDDDAEWLAREYSEE